MHPKFDNDIWASSIDVRAAYGMQVNQLLQLCVLNKMSHRFFVMETVASASRFTSPH